MQVTILRGTILAVCVATLNVVGAENCVVDPAEYGFSPDAAPDVNRQALQRALDGGRRMVRTSKGGVYGLDGTVFIDSDTVLEFAPGTVLKKMKPYANVLVNRGAFNYGCDSNIVVRNVEISVNGMQGQNGPGSNAPGLRGNFAFYRVRNVECHNFSCFDLESSQYCWQAVDFDGLVLDGFTIRGKKDGVHLNCGRNFVIRNGVLRTGDDGIALNAGEWPGGCTPKMGSIENGVIENIVDEAGGKCNFIRVITGCWKEWHPGMKLQRNDIFKVGRNVYCVWPMPLSTNEYVSMTAPTHTHGVWKSPEGINFQFMQDDGETRADIRNVTVRNVRMECERAITCHWEICDWARLVHPEVPNVGYPVIDLRIENLVKTASGPVVYGDASCRVTFRNVRAERGQLIAMNRHSKGVRGTPLYASDVHVKAVDCAAAGGGADIFLDDQDGTGSVEISGWKGLRAARLGGRAMPRIAVSGDARTETTDALLNVAGPVTDKTAGWRFEASKAKDGKAFNPTEGWYPDKGGKLVSPRIAIPKAGVYYKLSFTGSAPVRSYETVAFYDAAGNMIADNYDVIYGERGTGNGELGTERRYVRIVFAQEGVKEAEVFFQSKAGCSVSDVRLAPATAEEAAKWCDSVYAQLPPVETVGGQGLPPRTLDALKTGKPWRILMLGDSIMQDTFHSQFHALVKRAYPKSDVTWLISVRGSTGCWYYCEPENFRKYVADYKPDCVFIGGISGWIHPEMPLNGGPAIASVARRVNEELGAEVVVMTPTLAIDLRVPKGTERGTAVAPSKFDHAALGDKAWKYDVAAAEELKAICAKSGWPLWDMFTPAYDWLFKTGLPSEFYSRDYVHSGELGKQIIGRIALAYFAAGNKKDDMTADAIVNGVHGYMPDNYVVPKEPEVLEKLEWLKDQKLALMMHFGMYSQMGIFESWALSDADAHWSRVQIDWTDDAEEFKRQYWDLWRSFNPVRFQPGKWARLAKENGFKYLVFTTKHHDGFCLFDTKYTDFKVTNPECPFSKNPRADIVKSVFDAFRAEGLGIAAYFSKPDWHSEDFWEDHGIGRKVSRMPTYDVKANPEKWARFREFTKNQIIELVRDYGPVDVIWLDGGQVQRKTGLDIGIEDIIAVARKYNPALISADRTAGGSCENVITPEQTVPPKPLAVPWESCITMGTGFSYRYDDTYKSPRELVHLLLDVVAKGGNLALNVAPGPDGRLPEPAIERMEALGAWLKANGDGIYATRPAAPFADGDWRFTGAKDGKTVFAFRLWKDGERDLLAQTIPVAEPKKVTRVVHLGTGLEVPFSVTGKGIAIRLPETFRTNPYADGFAIKK